jgi:hypothetical protein
VEMRTVDWNLKGLVAFYGTRVYACQEYSDTDTACQGIV